MVTTVLVGSSLPRKSFPRIGGPGVVSWSQGPMASVIFVPHAEACDNCARYIAGLASAVDGLREWATRAMVLVESGSPIPDAPPGVLLLADQGDPTRTQLGIGDDRAVVIQADRWGAVYQVELVGPGAAAHDLLPTPVDLVALAKYIDIQCPECGIPSKEWLGASPFPLG